MATIKAKRAGHCADCSRAFTEGTTIRWFPKIGTLCADKGACETYRAQGMAWHAANPAEVFPRQSVDFTPRTFSIPASVQSRADDLAAGIEAARAMLARVLA